jgi:hypothetical protein
MPIVTSGSFNVGAGNRCLEALTLGASNTAMGTLALATISTHDENTAIGRSALISSVGGQNTSIGYSAGSNHLIGSNNAFFGANAQPSATTISHEYTYGGGAVVNHRFANGNVSVLNGNVVMSTIGKGIDFSATSHAGTMTSELLADYEEGTWSPSPVVPVNLTSVVSVSARYTKVGRLVTVSGQVTATVTTSNVFTYFNLSALPFANGTVTTGAVQENGNLTVGTAQVNGNVLWGFFPAASAIVSGAAIFYYSVTYSV